MLQPLSKLLSEKKPEWDESDARHFTQTWLRERTKTGQLYCERFEGGVATIRAASPAVRMAAKLAEYDLEQALKKSGGPKLQEVKVVR